MISNVADILRLWYLIEILSPQSVKFNDENDDGGAEFPIKPGSDLPWSQLSARQQTLLDEPVPDTEAEAEEVKELAQGERPRSEFLIHLGISKIARFDQAILEKIDADRTALDDERISKDVCALATIELTEEGKYVPDSFMLSMAPWGLQQLRSLGIFEFVRRPKQKDFEQFKERVEKDLPISRTRALTADDIIALAEFVRERCGLEGVIEFERHARGTFYRLGLKDPGDLLNSFYYKDILEAMELHTSDALPNTLRSFFEIPNVERRRELLHETAALREIVTATSFPRGAWPNRKMKPALMQQAAVILAQNLTDSQPLLAVNGPPGTGKTTMVRSLLADLTVKRARRMCESKGRWKCASDEDNPDGGHYYSPPPSLTGFEIVVASSNNGAVENISDELPDAASVDGFLDILKPQDHDYFLPVAKNVAHYRGPDMGHDTWGLIAASLGNKKKRTAFIEPFLYNDKSRKRPMGHATIREYLRNAPPLDWDEVKGDFLESLEHYERQISAQKRDKAFWSGDLKELHESVPGFDDDLLTKAQDLFVKALRVHRAYIKRNWGFIEHNLHRWAKVARRPDLFPIEQATALWQTLFLIVPVISTTFASASRMLRRFRSIGWVIIDEAGQAVPQASLGLLMRARRALIIGDPLQLEPVVTLSSAIVRILRNILKVDAEWVAANDTPTSLQTVVERVTPWGSARRSRSGKTQWVGVPLVVHRRCLDPMFGVANDVVYGGDMIYCTPPCDDPNLYPFGDSAWIDERSARSGRHAVKEQVSLALTIVRTMNHHYSSMRERITREKHGLADPEQLNKIRKAYNAPDIRVITPFREIEGSFMEIARSLPEPNWRAWCEDRVGTVHKAQGKEARVIICVLGLDQSKSGAAEFATVKPNFLNVAITRAKHRLYVIGNSRVWAHKDYFRDLYAAFEDLGAVISAESFLTRYAGVVADIPSPKDPRISLISGQNSSTVR